MHSCHTITVIVPVYGSYDRLTLVRCVLERWRIQTAEPDVILCDGQGIAHPRGMGLASHLGLLIKKPTIGCAKKRLVGEFCQVGPNRGDYSHLIYNGKKIGAVVRTRTDIKPVFVSPGYAVKTGDAVSLVLKCVNSYRIPEPIRKAHLLANRLRQRGEAF